MAPFALSSRLVTNGEYLAFMEAGGYADAALWLAEGWDWVRAQHLNAPLYWHQDGTGQWREFTLYGAQPLDLQRPVTHLSLFEADAYAHWVGARLPTEAEWEFAAVHAGYGAQGAVMETGYLHPAVATMAVQGTRRAAWASASPSLQQMFGHCWQWTSSSYSAYPGFLAAAGALGEYNGKFMLNQYVLRGASCATPGGHARISYRNFFPAGARWQFTGIRLARQLAAT